MLLRLKRKIRLLRKFLGSRTGVMALGGLVWKLVRRSRPSGGCWTSGIQLGRVLCRKASGVANDSLKERIIFLRFQVQTLRYVFVMYRSELKSKDEKIFLKCFDQNSGTRGRFFKGGQYLRIFKC